MLLDDPVGDREAEAGALADFLGREERIEDARQDVRGNPRTRVLHDGDHLAIPRLVRHADVDAARIAGGENRVLGVDQDVQECLVHQERIAHHGGKVGGFIATTSIARARQRRAVGCEITRESTRLMRSRRRVIRREPANTSRFRTIFAARSAS